jgi:hypothetical protein
MAMTPDEAPGITEVGPRFSRESKLVKNFLTEVQDS